MMEVYTKLTSLEDVAVEYVNALRQANDSMGRSLFGAQEALAIANENVKIANNATQELQLRINRLEETNVALMRENAALIIKWEKLRDSKPKRRYVRKATK